MKSVSRVRRVGTAVVVAIAGAAVGAPAFGQAGQAGGGAQAAAPVKMDVPFNGASRTMMVRGLDGPSASAGMEVAGSPSVQFNMVLRNQVVVRSDDADLVLKALQNRPGAAVVARAPELVPVEQMPGWVVVELGSVGDAIEAAQHLRSTGLFPSVSVEMEAPHKNHDLPSDPMVPQQWHLRNTANPAADLNVAPVYAQGITGQGVVVGVLEAFDDSFLPTHPDLAANWAASLSMMTTPFPTEIGQFHPTAVAGVIGAVGNNGVGVAGVAYDAKLARLRNGPTIVMSQALQWYYNDIHVKNNSWGFTNPLGAIPFHDGYVTDHSMDALWRALQYGRGGDGTIFVFSGGNERLDGEGITGVGGVVGDRVDYNPLASNRKTISVGAVLDDNSLASYSSTGNSLLVTAHSGPGGADSPLHSGIVTTGVDRPAPPFPPNVDETYINYFNGTSASAPIVAGTIALMLQANPDLDWRDVQHILKETSRVVNFTNGSLYLPPFGGDSWWQVNGAFTRHSDEYGFGVIDAEAAVNAALSWTPLPPEESVDTFTVTVDAAIPDMAYVEVAEDTYVLTSVEILQEFCVRPNFNVESIEVMINTTGGRRGDLLVTLYSPWGSLSVLAYPRYDFVGGFAGDYKWAQPFPEADGFASGAVFTTLKHWDENASGVWQVGIADGIPDELPEEEWTVDWFPFYFEAYDQSAGEQTWVDYRVVMHGTFGDPTGHYLCDPNFQGCPGDINGDGVVTVADFQLFLQYYYAGDPFADLNYDGVVTYADLMLFLAQWEPGYCDGSDTEGPGGRPMPGSGGSGGRPVGGPGGQ